jgi:hypothetical protein
MIKNDQQLTIVQQQIERAQNALRSLRREVRPLNESRFALMAESYVDTINELRRDVDAYLGVAEIGKGRAEFVLGLEGEGIQLGESPGSLVSKWIDTFRRSLQSIVEAANSSKPRDAGRPKRWVEKLCDLPLIGIAPGSVEIRLGEPTTMGEGLLASEEQEFYDEVTSLLRHGLAIASGVDELEEIPTSIRDQVLIAVRKLAPSKRSAINSVRYGGRALGGPVEYRLNYDSIHRIDRLVREDDDLERITSAIGIIREVDLDQNRFQLRSRPLGEPDLHCQYSESEENDVKEFLDQRVVVRGEIQSSTPTARLVLMVDSIEAVGDEEQT